MKALTLEQAGPEPRLAVRDVPTPRLEGDQALVKVGACGFCHHDLLVMRGVLRRGVKAGLTLGHEISGWVAEVGPEVRGLQVGDRVASIQTDVCGRCDRCRAGREHRCVEGHGIGHSIDGGWAEYVRLRESSLVQLPEDIDWETACLLGCPMGVMQHAIAEVGRVRPGEVVVVTGAGGGLGAHGVQLAKAAGARVYAVTGREEKVEPLRSLGAEEVVCVSDLDYSEVVLALTGDAGVEVVLDTVGSPGFGSAFRCLAQYGRLVALGEVDGKATPLRLAEVIFRDASILGSSGASRDDLRSALGLVREGQVRAVVGGRFPLEGWPEALRMMTEGEHVGRVVFRQGA